MRHSIGWGGGLEAAPSRGAVSWPHLVGSLGQLTGSFDSNERDVMADYYFRARRASPPDYYIYVHHPLSLDPHLPAFVALEYRWIREILVDGRRVIDIYESPRVR